MEKDGNLIDLSFLDNKEKKYDSSSCIVLDASVRNEILDYLQKMSNIMICSDSSASILNEKMANKVANVK
jgi:hypothetical protein